MKKILSIIAAILLISSCSKQLPTDFTQSDAYPYIYPAYMEVTIPVNIAPLAFEMYERQWEEMAVRYFFGDEEIICRGKQSLPPIDEWKKLTAAAQGKAIQVETYACKEGQWTRFKPFKIYVSPDSIDSYISYRLIHPSYVL